MFRRFHCLFVAAVVAGMVPSLARAEDWVFEQKPGASGAILYAARIGTRMGLECGAPAPPSLWVTVSSLAWKELAGAEALLGFTLRKTGILTRFGGSENTVVGGRFDQRAVPTFVTARVTGDNVLALAKKLSGFDEVAISIEPKGSVSMMPSPSHLVVGLNTAAKNIDMLLKSCAARG